MTNGAHHSTETAKDIVRALRKETATRRLKRKKDQHAKACF